MIILEAARRALRRGALLGSVSLTLMTAGEARAETPMDRPVEFHVSGGDLDHALTQAADQSGVHIFFPSASVAGKKSVGLSGKLTVNQALARLLSGSGLSWHLQDGKTIIVSASSNITLGPVRVGGTSVKESATGPGNGYVAKYTASSTKTDTPLTEIPNSIYVITKAQMVDQQSQTVQEVLRYMPGIYSESTGTASWGSGGANNQGGGNFTQRGFSSTQYIDGLLSSSEASAEPAFLDRVEALNGPSSVMYGQSGAGGLISMQLKKPTETPLRNATIGFGNWGRYEATLDLSDKITKSGNVKYRIAAIGVTQGTQTDHVNYHRVGVLPSIKWDIDDKTNLTLVGMYMYTPGIGSGNYYPLLGTLLPGKSGYIPRNRFLGDPEYNTRGTKEAKFEYQFSHKFNKNIEFQQNFSYQDSRLFFNDTFGSGLAADGKSYSIFGWKGALGNDTAYIQKTVAVDTRLIGHLDTGPVHQVLLAGVDYRHVDQEAGLTYDRTATTIDIWNPVVSNHPNYGSGSSDRLATYIYPIQWSQVGVYFQDQIKFEKLTVTLGGREDWYSHNNSTIYSLQAPTGNVAPAVTSSSKQSSSAFTWRAGFTYNFNFGLTPYFSFSKSFSPQYGSILADGSAAPPLTGNQLEAGLKYIIPNTNVFLTAAAYHIKENNVLESSPDVVGKQIDGGRAVSKGVELSAHANITKDLRLTASYSFDDMRYTRSNNTVTRYDIYGNSLGKAPLQGKYLNAYPRNMVNMFVDYTLPRKIFYGLGMNFGIRYIGSTYADTANSFKIPAYTLFDVGAHYDFANISSSLSGLKISLAMSNLTNKRFVSSCSTNQCYYGQARRVYGNISYSW
ncbi:TonB-dependent siderophore receptor [Acetobacter orientalis]|uniref:TonB-dependent siderophore receptor n=1 Tax=Acetobacter orientalis TaxID=146474 RepID=UPI00209C74F2|nr:TonB-dependent siderophore receptor [Acetobacter orientalis]MCP1216130.1 TonB-dependent siderophore receptor [Acetobacter orientalis]MCP1219019.1 TonB-dependent siderophore receptor [Acetobacter orientalis]